MLKDKLQEIIKLVEDSNINELEISTWWGRKIKVTKQLGQWGAAMYQPAPPTPAPPAIEITASESAPAPAVADNSHKVLAPVVGTYYTAASPDSPPYVKVGDKIKQGQVFCIIEAMKIMNEIECDVNGTVVDVLVANGEPVEYNQPLILIDPS